MLGRHTTREKNMECAHREGGGARQRAAREKTPDGHTAREK